MSKTIVAQTRADFELLRSMLVDTAEGVGRHLKIDLWFEDDPEIPSPPLDYDQVTAFSLFRTM